MDAHKTPDAVREAVQKGLEFVAVALAFLGRDRGTERESKTLDGLEIEARALDPIMRKALTALDSRAGDAGEGVWRQTALDVAKDCQRVRHSSATPQERDTALRQAATMLRSFADAVTPAPAVDAKARADMAAALRNTPAEALREAGYLERAAHMIEAVDAAQLETRSLEAMHRCSRREHQAVAPAIEWSPRDGQPGAYRVGHSLSPHLADGLTAQVCIGGGAYMTIPNPQSYAEGGIVWHLTYASDVRPYVLTAGSIIMSFDYLLSSSINLKEAMQRLRLLRKARAALSHGEGRK